MPITSSALLTDLKRWVTRFEDDLRQQCKDVPELDARLKAQYEQAKDGGRTAYAYAVWRDGELTQSAVGWVLGCVFVRFLEDNDLLERPFLSGVGENRDIADDTRAAWFREHRAASDNDYLAHVITEVGTLPGMADLMDARHNPLWNAAISPDAAKAFLEFWRRIDPDTGRLAHEFTDPEWDTRFLGDLYQDLSEAARKKFALLQTPDFVEEFILDRTLDPAIDTFGLKEVRMIDPTCGSGHFLLGGFRRLIALWERERPDLSDRERAAKALEGVYGVDINPFAVAIARFRLLLEAWNYSGVKRLRNAPDFKVNLAAGDSLLHGARFDSEGKPYVVTRDDMFGGDEVVFRDETVHHFEVEDGKELHRILGQQYHAVVGNPPYISVKDPSLKALYKKRYGSCAGKWVLSVPFMERFFGLALADPDGRVASTGFTGQITSNSFMKRDFGKKLVEEFVPRWDLTHVLDTSDAYIPHHKTPTVILFGRNSKPARPVVRAIMGIKGEDSNPEDPAMGKVWRAIVDQIDRPGSESEYVSASDVDRDSFQKHPWSVRGGGAAGLKEEVETVAETRLGKIVDQLRGKPNIGITSFTLEDDLFIQPLDVEVRKGLERRHCREMVEGDTIRDWWVDENAFAVWPYDSKFEPVDVATEPKLHRFLWIGRTNLRNNKMFGGKTKEQAGLKWYEFGRLTSHKLKTPLSITLAFVSTHNHFVLDRGGKVFKQSAPVIKLTKDATEEDHLRLLGLLNSSIACFWMKQVFYPKSTTTGDISSKKGKPEANRYEFAATGLKSLPVPVPNLSDSQELLAIAGELDQLGNEVRRMSGEAIVCQWDADGGELARKVDEAERDTLRVHGRMVYLQEELDWLVYRLYGLVEDHGELDPQAGIAIDERPFAWKSNTPPNSLPQPLRSVYGARWKLISSSRKLQLVENPVCKRLWLGRQGVYGSATGTYREKAVKAVGKWLKTRLESYFHDADRMLDLANDKGNAQKLVHVCSLRAHFSGGAEPRLVSVRQLAQVAQTDTEWMEAAAVYTECSDFDVPELVEKLVTAESVPALPAQRYKPAGLRKRVEWEKTWDLQREEDRIDAEREALEKQIEARIDAVLAERESDLPARVVTKRDELDAAERAFHAEFFPDSEYDPEQPHHARDSVSQEPQRSSKELNLQGLADELNSLESELKRERRAIRSEDDEVRAHLEAIAQLPEKPKIDVPPKFGDKDYLRQNFWRLRGKLDVPKERWVIYPGAEGGIDASPVIAWAGWDHAQQAGAVTSFYQQATDAWGWEPERLAPLLAALKELLPWLHQWHNDLDPEYGDRISTTYQQFYDTERHTLRVTEEEIEAIRMGGGAS